MCQNTAPFALTGHPAITVNAGMSEGLPVGIMFVGRCWDEASTGILAFGLPMF